MSEQWYIEIRRSSDDGVVKRMGPMSEHKADRVFGGVNINLDHENYYADYVGADSELAPVVE